MTAQSRDQQRNAGKLLGDLLPQDVLESVTQFPLGLKLGLGTREFHLGNVRSLGPIAGVGHDGGFLHDLILLVSL